jgi:hypothetical protein
MDSRLEKLIAQLPTLRREAIDSPFGQIPKSVDELSRLLNGSLTEGDKAHVYHLLLSECSRSRNDALLLHWLRARVKAFPRDPIAQCGLAFHIALTEPSRISVREESLDLTRRALSIAFSQNVLVRYSATMLVRIGLLLDDYAAVKEGLVALIRDGNQQRLEDQRLEFDFLDQIDPKRLDSDLLDTYARLAT